MSLISETLKNISLKELCIVIISLFVIFNVLSYLNLVPFNSTLMYVAIIAYFIFIHKGMCDFSIKSSYLWFSVVLPIFLNVIINFAVRKVDKSKNISHDFKNDFVMYGICATACVVAIIHRDYGVMSGAYVFPIVLSASYNQKRLLNNTFYISIASLTFTMVIQVLQLLN